ncbi:MAG: zinc metalloprotease HtpX [bacterium]
MNYFKTTVLLAALAGLFILVGGMLGGEKGALLALLVAGVMNFATYWFSDRIVLAIYRAKKVSETDAPRLYRIVRQLAANNQMPFPAIYVIPDEAPNAFATGRNPQHAAVAATEGIMRILNDEELEGVMAHELMHVANRDTLISTIAASIAGALTYLAQWGMFFGGGGRGRDSRGNPLVALLLAIIAPLAAMMIQMAISRSREYVADAGGGKLCGRPLALASALRKLHRAADLTPMSVGTSATASLFIVNPFGGGGVTKLFSTHPPVAERIRRLELQARGL